LRFRGIFAASLALVFVLAALTVGFAYNELESETRAAFWVDHTHRVIEQNQFVLTQIQRAESAERTYLLSGDPKYLAVYSVSQQRLPGAQADLTRLVADNPGEAARVGRLNQAVGWRAAQLARSIELAQGGDPAAAKAASLANPAIAAQIRATSDEVTASEHILLEERIKRAGAANDVSLIIGLCLSALSLVALVVLVFYLARSNERLVGAMDETARANAGRDLAEQRLREAQRMEAMGHLTGGLAHDFNNLLQVIRGNLELLESSVSDPAARRRLDSAIQGADRAAQLTRQLLAFARRQPLAVQVVDLSRLIADMSDILRRTLGEEVEVAATRAPDLWHALADPAQLESAILNLAINARDAMPGGGRLAIEAANIRLTEAELDPGEEASPGDYVVITLSDSGEGMDPETLARAMEPFFTTKANGKGSGLGLSMVYGFVRQSNGRLRLDSDPGRGTRVSLYLPRGEGAPPEAQAPASTTEGAADRTILVVEDDANVRATAVTMLETLGYRCLEAGDASSAVALLEGDPAVDLVFSDVMMPGPMKARDMAERLRQLRPEVPILFASGYPREEIGSGGQLDADVTLLAKPYAREDLARKVAQLISGSKAQPA
jgi:signal transduction histidine kinase/ActR/RegA family two-component response regulator